MKEPGEQTLTPTKEPAIDERLDSWKEIAAYLKRDVRTVRRWEEKEGLPVHRHLHHKRSSVYAYKTQLDTWWKNTRSRAELESADSDTSHRGSHLGLFVAVVKRKVSFRPTIAASLALLAVVLAYLFLFQAPSTQLAPNIRSLAVLPLANLSDDPEQEYFSDGMTEALISDLGKVAGLRVVSRTSVMRYKGTKRPLPDIAQELNVDAVIEGSTLQVGNRVRITAQLIEAANDGHLWSDSYEGELSDVLGLQRDVARAIAREVQTRLTSDVPLLLTMARPLNPDAYEAYLRGRYQYNQRELKLALAYFNQAIDIEPDYALAYAGAADCYHKLGANHIFPPKEAFPRAKAMAMRALEIDDQLSEAYTTVAAMHTNHDWDWHRAEMAFKRAIELNPNYAEAHQEYAWLLTALGRMDEAVAEAQTALALDPFYAPRHSHLGMALYRAKRYEEAIEQFRMLLDRFRQEAILEVPTSQLSLALVQSGKYEEAISTLQQAISLWGNLPSFSGVPWTRLCTGRTEQAGARGHRRFEGFR